MIRHRAPLAVAALLLALAASAPPLPAEAKAKPAKTKPAARSKRSAALDESTCPTKPSAKIGAAEKAAFRDAFVRGIRGRHAPDPALVEALASDLSDFYATRQITAEEVNAIRDALAAHLDLPNPSPADLDGLSGRVNAVTEGSNLDIADMEGVAAAARAVAESVRIDTAVKPAGKKTEPDGKRGRRRGFFRRLFGR